MTTMMRMLMVAVCFQTACSVGKMNTLPHDLPTAEKSGGQDGGVPVVDGGQPAVKVETPPAAPAPAPTATPAPAPAPAPVPPATQKVPDTSNLERRLAEQERKSKELERQNLALREQMEDGLNDQSGMAVDDGTGGTNAGFIPSGEVTVMYVGSWPVNLKLADGSDPENVRETWLAAKVYLHPRVEQEYVLVALPKLVRGAEPIATDKYGNVAYEPVPGTTDIIAIGLNGRQRVSQQPNGTYHVTCTTPWFPGAITRQMRVVLDGKHAPHLEDVLAPGQHGKTELPDGVAMGGDAYTEFANPTAPLRLKKTCKDVKVNNPRIAMCG